MQLKMKGLRMLELIKISRSFESVYLRIGISKFLMILLFTCTNLYVDNNHAADAGPAEQKQDTQSAVRSLVAFSSVSLASQFAAEARAGGGNFIENLIERLNTLPIVQRPKIVYPIIFREGITFKQAKQLVQYLLQSNIEATDKDILNFLIGYFNNMPEEEVVTVDFYVNERKLKLPETGPAQGPLDVRRARGGMFSPVTSAERPKPPYLLTLLFEAARLGNLPAARMLLANGADPLKMTKRGFYLGFNTRFIQNNAWDWEDVQRSITPTGFMDVIRNRDQDVLQLLADAGINPIILLKLILSNISKTATMRLNDTKHISDLCLWLLDLPGVNPNYIATSSSRPIIFLAIEAGLPDVVQRLIDLGADMNSLYPNLNMNPKEYFLKMSDPGNFLFKDFNLERLRQIKRIFGVQE